MRSFKFASVMLASVFVLGAVMVLPDAAEGGKAIFASSVLVASGVNAQNTQHPYDMGVGPDGTIYILYLSDHTFKWGVYMVHSKDGGLTWSPPFRVDDILRDGNTSNDDRNAKQNPRMAIGGDGMIYVVWEDHRKYLGDEVGTRPIEIRFSRSVDGENFTQSRKIDADEKQKVWHAYRPDIAVNSANRLVAVWQDLNGTGAYRNIYSSYSTDRGDTWSYPILINTDGTYYRGHDHPRVVIHGTDVYVTWHDKRNDTLGPKPFLAVSHDGGVSYLPEINVTDDIEEDQSRTNVEPAVDEAGNLYLIWTDTRSGHPEVWMTRSEDKGATLAKNYRVVNVPERAQDIDPVIAAFSNGIVAISWCRESFNIEGDPIERDLLYLNSTDGGRTWSPMLRVDDSDRFKNDLTDQEAPQIAFTYEGRSILTWKDGRRYLPIEIYRDLYFTRHSGSISGPNVLPQLSLSSFQGPFAFNRTLGNASSVFDFRIVYSDFDNDMPDTGYPRMRIYRDDQGMDPFSDWIPMYKSNESNSFYIEGVEYAASTTIPVEGSFFWRVETVEERAPDVVRSPVFKGPRIDTTPPQVRMLSPEENVWFGSDIIECSARVTDSGGAHVNPNSIKFQKSLNIPDAFERGVPASRFQMIDQDTYDGWAQVPLGQGKENYVRFEAYDMVGNGPAISSYIQLWVDSAVPYYIQVSPLATDTQIYTTVNCSIVWMDHALGTSPAKSIGLDPSTIMYAFRTTNQGFSEWIVPEETEMIGDDTYRSWVHLTFSDKGVYNFIKWRAADLLGNEKVTPELRINVFVPDNYPPVFVGRAFPNLVASEVPHLWWEDAFDEEGDTLYYKVMIMTAGGLFHFSSDIDVGRRTFFDVTDGKRLTPGFWILRVNVTDRIGGWDVLEHSFRVTDFGTPPPEDVPPVGPYYIGEAAGSIGWSPSPSAGSREVHYLCRIGTERYMRDVIDWTDIGPEPVLDLGTLELGVGIYSFQVMAYADDNYSRVSEGMLKISDYNIDLKAPDQHLAYRGRAFSKVKPMSIELTNFGTYGDNITLTIEGEIAAKEWVYFSESQNPVHTISVPSSKVLTTPSVSTTTVIFYPPENAQEGDYRITIRAVSEDNETSSVVSDILVRVREAPDESKGGALSQGIYDLVTKLFPFLEGLPQWLVVLLFFVFVVLIIGGVVTIGILVVKRGQRKKTEDPYEKQKQIYRELYGAEPPEGFTGEAPQPSGEDLFDVDKLFDEGSKAPDQSGPEAPGPAEAPGKVSPPVPQGKGEVKMEGDTLTPE